MYSQPTFACISLKISFISSLQSEILVRKKQSILRLTALKAIKLYCIENYFFDVPQSTSINKAIPIPAIKKKILILFFFTNPTIPMIIKRIETINDI